MQDTRRISLSSQCIINISLQENKVFIFSFFVLFMPKYEPLDPDAEVLGSSINSTINSFPKKGRSAAKQIYARHGIDNPTDDKWYPHKLNLAAMSTLYDKFGPSMLHKIGRDKPKNTAWPPDIETATDAVMSINDAYQRNHRNGEVGGYHAEQLGQSRIKLVCDNPYPCPFDEGLIEGVAFEFATGTAIINEVGDECREESGERCTYEVNLY
jgi:hypothetical protein